MVDRLPSSDRFEALKAVAKKNNGSSAVPMDLDGNAKADLLYQAVGSKPYYKTTVDRIATAAIVSHQILSGADLHHYPEYVEQIDQDIAPIDIGDVKFRPELGIDPELNHLQKPENPLALNGDPVELINELLTSQSQSLKPLEEGKPLVLYSPYVTGESLDTQVEVTPQIKKIHEDLTFYVGALRRGLSVVSLRIINPTLGVIVNPTTQLQYMPNCVPFTRTKEDFDSGNTNEGLISSATHGKSVAILALYNDYVLVRSSSFSGWAHQDSVAVLPQDFDERGYNTVYYSDSIPRTINAEDGSSLVFLPGHKLLEKGGDLFIVRRDEDSQAYLTRVVESERDPLKYIKRGLKPQQMLNLFCKNGAPYMWSHNDCSGAFNTVCEAAGFADMPKQSAVIISNLAEKLGKEQTPVDHLPQGLYAVGKPGHLYLGAVDATGKQAFYSVGFQFFREDRSIGASPIGLSQLTADEVMEFKRAGQELTIVRLTQLAA